MTKAVSSGRRWPFKVQRVRLGSCLSDLTIACMLATGGTVQLQPAVDWNDLVRSLSSTAILEWQGTQRRLSGGGPCLQGR